MAYDLTLPLDPTSQSGLTVAVQLYANGVLAKTVSLVESPSGSAIYTNTANITSLAANSYIVRAIASGTIVGVSDSPFVWDGTAEVVGNLNVVNVPSATLDDVINSMEAAGLVEVIALQPQQTVFTPTPTVVTGVEIGPAQLAASVGGTYQSVSLFQNSAPVLQYTVKTAVSAVDLTGHLFSFTIFDDFGTPITAINSTANTSQFALSSSGQNSGVLDRITVSLQPTNLATPGIFTYNLKDLTLNTPLATGQLGVLLSV